MKNFQSPHHAASGYGLGYDSPKNIHR